jgi:hypothetical protein
MHTVLISHSATTIFLFIKTLISNGHYNCTEVGTGSILFFWNSLFATDEASKGPARALDPPWLGDFPKTSISLFCFFYREMSKSVPISAY